MSLDAMCRKLCEAERDRMASAEICIDEALTIMDRHGINYRHPIYCALSTLSGEFHRAMTMADGPSARISRMVRVRKSLTEAFPLSDDDLGADEQTATKEG